LTSPESAGADSVAVLDAVALLQLELSGNRLIEASAGTGKTHTIADLYLRHILDGRLTSEILVVTYTNAATEELRGRVQDRLYQALALINADLPGDGPANAEGLLSLWRAQWSNLDSEQQETQRGRLQLALRSFDEACISTIHSFCQRSLQEHALAGNQLFETELISDDRELWEDAIKDWWRRLSYDLDRDTWLLVHDSLGSLQKLTGELLQLRNKPALKLLPESPENLATLLARPRQIAQQLYRLAPQWNRHKDELIEILRDSKALSRAQALPYHSANLDAWLDAADLFFNAADAGVLFDQFEFLGAPSLHQHSKPSLRGKDPRLEHDFFHALGEVATTREEFRRRIGPLLRIDALRAISEQVGKIKRELAVLAFQDQLNLLLDALLASAGKTLAEQLRQQYPVAMIDEFQDTDAIQYRIFELIYGAAGDSCLTLIGDPKQAIYSFRGGDIFTYMQARKRPAIQHYNLQVNWRSQPDLVKAVNTLFTMRPDAFVYPDSIDFRAAEANPANRRYQLLVNQQPLPALTLWQLPLTEQHGNHSRAEMRELINQAIVSEISGLLQAAARGAASIDGKPVASGDIAILVRQASEGQALARILRQHGIRAVTIGRDSVFHSDEAHGLYDLLLAVAQCNDSQVAARSLASNLLQLDYLQIAAIVDDDRAWQHWLEDLDELQQLWQRQGFIAMFQALLQRFDITRHLALMEGSERRITNLLHLAELLQQQSLLATGLSPLLRWFEDQFESSGAEDAELRLEDDEALVKIVTIHKAKGLQYPIVFVPFLWSCKPVEKNGPLYYHDDDLTACIDLGSEAFGEHWLRAEKERLAEDLRLLYVALTRARSRLYLAWGTAGSKGRPGFANQTALAFLLHSRQTHADLDSTAADGFGDDVDIEADLQRLVDASDASIERVALPRPSAPLSWQQDRPEALTPRLASFSRSQTTQWRIHSFTGLTRAVHQPASRGNRTGEADPILEFPAGSQVGLLMHSLLENLDFDGDIDAQCEPLLNRFMTQSGVAEDHRPTLLHWLKQILATPLDGDSLTLNRITNRYRLNELGFDFALDRIDFAALNQFMQSRFEQPLQALSGVEFRGLITGVIDLVFEYQGRYYLADYKSNYLGSELQDYGSAKLQQAMLDRRYDLQSMLYLLALHRLLAQRIVDYDYERHFGGSYYLFLRALRPDHGSRYGVFFERPDAATIARFDELFRYTPTAVVDA
jgi:exodeoxyribonuclease V beta subunit